MKKLYCFDFDGTITTKDTMFLFLEFYRPRRFRMQLVRFLPLFILLKMKLAQAGKVKQAFISSILKGERKEDLEAGALRFFEINYPKIIRQNALDFIQNIDRDHSKCLIVTASLDIWTKPFAEKFGMTLLATAAEYKDGVFTGKFASPNCNGEQKLIRILAEIKDEKFDKSIAFGDTGGDRAMLNWADEGHFTFFH